MTLEKLKREFFLEKGGTYYCVKEGDRLSSIAEKIYGHKGYWYPIAQANKINPNQFKLYPYNITGEKLYLPRIKTFINLKQYDRMPQDTPTTEDTIELKTTLKPITYSSKPRKLGSVKGASYQFEAKVKIAYTIKGNCPIQEGKPLKADLAPEIEALFQKSMR